MSPIILYGFISLTVGIAASIALKFFWPGSEIWAFGIWLLSFLFLLELKAPKTVEHAPPPLEKDPDLALIDQIIQGKKEKKNVFENTPPEKWAQVVQNMIHEPTFPLEIKNNISKGRHK